ncbi:MAG: putative Ig domain-containing protein [Synergistaceae bacterium]|nr:putative Ig domain-containing protein [Synergistaceae bacterium]
MQSLMCKNNQLTTLDVSGCSSLTDLYCDNNQLTILDVSVCYVLQELWCYDNQLTAFDLCECTALDTLECDFKIESTDEVYYLDLTDFLIVHNLDGDYDSSHKFTAYSTWNEIIATSETGTATISNSSGKQIMYFLKSNSQQLKYIEFYFKPSSITRPIVQIRVYPRSGASSGSSTPSSTTSIAPIIVTTNLPDGTEDSIYSAALSAIGSTPITWTLLSGSLPAGLTLDSAGSISGTPTTSGAFSFTAQATNSAGSSAKLFTILVPFSADRSPKITTDSLNTAYTNSPYGFKLTASGTTPLTWSLASGSSLPDGLTLTTSGYIYGTPSTADTTAFTVCAANSAGTASQDFSLTVSEYPAQTRPAVMTEDPYPAAQGSSYVCQLMASGNPPFTWTLAKGKLPAGLSMTDSELITGTPTKATAAKLAFNVSNDYGKETRTLTLNVCTLPEITTKSLKDAAAGKKYTETIKGTGTKPLTWKLEGSLPQGISLFEADNAKITGTPSANDTGIVRVTLSNPAGEVSKVFTLKVSAVLPKITTKTLKAAAYGKNYSAAIKIKGSEPITVILSGDLPEGLTFDSSTGKITGTPSEVCSDRKITAIACNIAGVVSLDYSLTIKAVAPKITTKKLPDASQNSTYSFDVEAAGTPSITWSAEGLPAGLSISTTGSISGTPTESGKFSVKVSAANSAKTVTKNYKLIVTASTAQTAASVQKAGNPHQTADTLNSETGYTAQNTHNVSAINDVETNDDVFAGGYSIAAELGTVSVDETGMYDFTVTLSDDVPAGKKLLYLAGSSEPSEDDSIAEFYGNTGKEVSAVPDNRNVTVSVWLKKNVIYTPSLAVRH